MRFIVYTFVSAVLAVLAVILPLINRPNFFSASIAIYQNSACVLVLVNMCAILAFLIGKAIQLIFFGQLHTIETERLYESAWYAITESVLLLPLFRDDSKTEFGIFFGLLLFLRIFHWICADRIDLIFQTVNRASYLNHLRLSMAIILLGAADLYLVRYWVMTFQYSSNSDRNSVMVPTFSFECLLLFNSIFNTAGKYILNIIEAIYLKKHEDEDIWESKLLYTFYLDVVTKFSRLLAYGALFFFILLPYRLLPLHIIRDCYITFMSLVNTIHTYVRSRRAKRQIETVVRTVTQEELSSVDDVCIICREEMILEENQVPRTVPKKLLCGHIIHFGCLKSWLERSLRCPTCRRSVMDGTFPNQPRGSNNNNNNGRDAPAQAPAPVPVPATGAGAVPQQPHENIPRNWGPNNNNQNNQNINGEAENGHAHGFPTYMDWTNRFNNQAPNINPPLHPSPTTQNTQPESNNPSFQQQDQHQQRIPTNSSLPGSDFGYTHAAIPSEVSFGIPYVFGNSSHVLSDQIEIPDGFQLPQGWGVIGAKETPDGMLQIQLSKDNWVTIMPNHASSAANSVTSTSKTDSSQSKTPLVQKSRDKGKFFNTSTNPLPQKFRNNNENENTASSSHAKKNSSDNVHVQDQSNTEQIKDNNPSADSTSRELTSQEELGTSFP